MFSLIARTTLALFVSSTLCFAEDAGLVFHFNFKDAAGEREIADTTGRFRCVSGTAPFQIEKDTLRIAPGAQITIPSKGVPPLTEGVTVSAWIFKSSTPDVTPILMKGVHPSPIQFLFGVGWRYPIFCYKNVPAQSVWKGISYDGFFGGTIRYANPAWLKNEAALLETGGRWYHVSAVHQQGTTRLYVDGVLAAEQEQGMGESLLPNDQPFYVGVEMLDRNGKRESYATANMLLNDLRLYQRALTAQEITDLYRQERPAYPEGVFIPEGKTHTSTLAPCYAYLGPEYDPLFERTLERTAAYEKNLPENPYAQKATTAAIVTEDGKSVMRFDDKPVYPLAISPAPLNYATNEYRFREAGECVKDFAAAGVNIVLEGAPPARFWLGEGKYDWEAFDEFQRYVLKSNPAAKLIVSLALLTPPWFDAKYPEELEKYQHGKDLRTMRLSGVMGSEVWLRVSLQMIRDVVRHVEASDYSGNVLGYLCAGGQSAEWYWPGGLDGYPGYSVGTRATFQAWLKEAYEGDEARLRKMWNDPEVTFATAEVPPAEVRKNIGPSFFIDPEKDARELDFRRFLNASTARHLASSARAIKENSTKLVFAYHGYGMASEGSRKLYNNGLLGLQAAFRNPDIDCIIGLIDYTRRRAGEGGLTINPFYSSARLHGKLLWEEHDIRTHLALGIMGSEKTENLQETLAVIERGFGMTLTRDGGMWWRVFDNDWFHQEEMMDSIAAMERIGSDSLKANKSSVAEVAFIFDESIPYYSRGGDTPFLRQHLWGAVHDSSRMGAPADFYMVDDLGNPDMPDYKLYIFLNAYRTDPQMESIIARKVRRNNAVAVWCYAPGYLNGGNRAGAMKALTGISLSPVDGERKASLNIQTKNHPITRHAQDFTPYAINPAFEVNDPEATVLGTFGGTPALAVREFGDWRSVYSLMPLNKELLQGLCDYAGVHVYLRSFDVFNVNHDYMVIHSSSAGEKPVALRTPATVEELFSHQVISRNAEGFTETMKSGSTRVYRIMP